MIRFNALYLKLTDIKNTINCAPGECITVLRLRHYIWKYEGI